MQILHAVIFSRFYKEVEIRGISRFWISQQNLINPLLDCSVFAFERFLLHRIIGVNKYSPGFSSLFFFQYYLKGGLPKKNVCNFAILKSF